MRLTALDVLSGLQAHLSQGQMSAALWEQRAWQWSLVISSETLMYFCDAQYAVVVGVTVVVEVEVLGIVVVVDFGLEWIGIFPFVPTAVSSQLLSVESMAHSGPVIQYFAVFHFSSAHSSRYPLPSLASLGYKPGS